MTSEMWFHLALSLTLSVPLAMLLFVPHVEDDEHYASGEERGDSGGLRDGVRDSVRDGVRNDVRNDVNELEKRVRKLESAARPEQAR